MFKTETTERSQERIIKMSDMKPGDIGQVHAFVPGGMYDGHLVMRTFSSDKFEVMDLSDPGKNSCWQSEPAFIKVELLPPGSKVTLTVE
jgi:hypothetical protein